MKTRPLRAFFSVMVSSEKGESQGRRRKTKEQRGKAVFETVGKTPRKKKKQNF